MTFLDYEHKLVELRLKKTQVAREIESRFGEKLTSSELNKIMRGFQSGDKAERVKREVEQILSDLAEIGKGGEKA